MKKIHNNYILTERRRELRKKATPQEAILWSQLRNRYLGVKFRRQHSIGDFIVDFYCAEKKLIIEIDGMHHTLKDFEYDMERDFALKELGLTILRIKNREVDKNLEDVLNKIKVAVEPFSREGEGQG